MSDVTYVCSFCRKEVSAGAGEAVPLCCGKEMEPLPFCTTVPDPEMSRNDKTGEPCDDATGPRKRR